VGCFGTVNFRNDPHDCFYGFRFGGIKTIGDLMLLERAAKFRKKLRGMNDEIVFAVPPRLNETKGTGTQQDQQQKGQDSL